MNDNEPTTRYRYAKRVGTTAGLAAVAAMAALSLAHGESAPTSSTLAGSGDAPANTTYSQPVVAGMNMGATATWATPASTLATSMAVPPLKAGG
jgi:hypothetical protein